MNIERKRWRCESNVLFIRIVRVKTNLNIRTFRIIIICFKFEIIIYK